MQINTKTKKQKDNNPRISPRFGDVVVLNVCVCVCMYVCACTCVQMCLSLQSPFTHSHACARTHARTHALTHTHLDSAIATDVIHLPRGTWFQEMDHDLCRVSHVCHVTLGLQIAVVKRWLHANTQLDHSDLHCKVLGLAQPGRHLSKETYNVKKRPTMSKRDLQCQKRPTMSKETHSPSPGWPPWRNLLEEAAGDDVSAVCVEVLLSNHFLRHRAHAIGGDGLEGGMFRNGSC